LNEQPSTLCKTLNDDETFVANLGLVMKDMVVCLLIYYLANKKKIDIWLPR